MSDWEGYGSDEIGEAPDRTNGSDTNGPDTDGPNTNDFLGGAAPNTGGAGASPEPSPRDSDTDDGVPLTPGLDLVAKELTGMSDDTTIDTLLTDQRFKTFQDICKLPNIEDLLKNPQFARLTKLLLNTVDNVGRLSETLAPGEPDFKNNKMTQGASKEAHASSQTEANQRAEQIMNEMQGLAKKFMKEMQGLAHGAGKRSNRISLRIW